MPVKWTKPKISNVLQYEHKVGELAESWTSVVHLQLYFEGSENNNNYLVSMGFTFLDHNVRPRNIPIPPTLFTRILQLEARGDNGINKKKRFSKLQELNRHQLSIAFMFSIFLNPKPNPRLSTCFLCNSPEHRSVNETKTRATGQDELETSTSLRALKTTISWLISTSIFWTLVLVLAQKPFTFSPGEKSVYRGEGKGRGKDHFQHLS